MSAAAESWSTLLTPSGPGAIGVIRVCGPQSLPVISQLFRSERAVSGEPNSLSDGRLRYGRLFDGDELLDDVLISAVSGASTLTFEITAHGGVRILERILSALETRGVPFRAATREVVAFPTANLIEHEAWSHLQQARTPRAALFLARQKISLPRALQQICGGISKDSSASRAALADLLGRSTAAIGLTHGITIVLVGPPNSGKSTLFNRLLGRSAAVVSPQPGTTRDWISADLDMLGLPVRLIDTAGIRSDADALEAEAITRGRNVADSAALRLLVLDANRLPTEEAAISEACAHPPAAILMNKMEVCANPSAVSDAIPAAFMAVPILQISAATGSGLSALSGLVLRRVGLDDDWDLMHPALFTARQVRMAEAWLQSDSTQFLARAADFCSGLLHGNSVA